MAKVQTGLDQWMKRHARMNRDVRVGVICHQATVDSQLRHILPLLRDAKINVTAIFEPEHGLWGNAQDQIPVDSSQLSDDQKPANAPIYSLYGDNRAPKLEQLANVDVVLCDLQDVGSRYYTFIWTMMLAMQVCAKAGKKFVVLDRPNPIDGVTLEGPVLDWAYNSFVGLYPVPVRHGLTMGEMALWLNHELSLNADLQVIPMTGWKRTMYYNDTGLPWVLPSPNMPTLDTAIVYPGGCLWEGTNLSEGRGTTRPFEIFGAPFIHAESLEKSLLKKKLPGVSFRATRFEPTFHKFEKQLCGGVQMHVTDRARFKPFITALHILQTIRELYPNDFAWRQPPYEYETVQLPIDILCGTDTIRKTIDAGASLSSIERTWQADLVGFRQAVQPYLLYN